MRIESCPPRPHGFTFTTGRGNDVQLAAIRALEPFLAGQEVDELLSDLGSFYRTVAGDGSLRWLGPERGVMHMAIGAVVNACWDMAARRAGQPLWRWPAGPGTQIALEANQIWDVPTAIGWMRELAPLDQAWIEEPTSPDDILGTATIRRGTRPVPVCPHAGGVGLCEIVQHLAMFDYVAVTGRQDGRAIARRTRREPPPRCWPARWPSSASRTDPPGAAAWGSPTGRKVNASHGINHTP